jgi:excinuclease ABC subunit B
LASQLARELRNFLPNNAVELFVSYYNYYVPESFKETTGTYIAKKASINDEIDALRHRATRALLQRQDVVVVSSVSCIYGLGLPAEYLDASIDLEVGQRLDYGMQELINEQIEGRMLYNRPDDPDELLRGNYQITTTSFENHKSQVLSIWPPHEKFPLRIELKEQVSSGDIGSSLVIKSIQGTHPVNGGLYSMQGIHIFPAKHHVMAEDRLEEACLAIEEEMKERVSDLMKMGKVVEANRLQQRTLNDVLLLRETGFCSGGENYSRHFAGRPVGSPPDTLIDYLKIAHEDWLLVVDESHVTLSQLKAMYAGDRARKEHLVKHGYRLPSAFDNRPLREDEFWQQVPQAVFVSATPSHLEKEWSERVLQSKWRFGLPLCAI